MQQPLATTLIDKTPIFVTEKLGCESVGCVILADPARMDQRKPFAFREFIFGEKVRGVQIPGMLDNG